MRADHKEFAKLNLNVTMKSEGACHAQVRFQYFGLVFNSPVKKDVEKSLVT